MCMQLPASYQGRSIRDPIKQSLDSISVTLVTRDTIIAVSPETRLMSVHSYSINVAPPVPIEVGSGAAEQ